MKQECCYELPAGLIKNTSNAPLTPPLTRGGWEGFAFKGFSGLNKLDQPRHTHDDTPMSSLRGGKADAAIQTLQSKMPLTPLIKSILNKLDRRATLAKTILAVIARTSLTADILEPYKKKAYYADINVDYEVLPYRLVTIPEAAHVGRH